MTFAASQLPPSMLSAPDGAELRPGHFLVEAMVAVGTHLQRAGYRFTTVTPATHARVLARHPERLALCMEDIFGWNMPFRPGILPTDLLSVMEESTLFTSVGPLIRSRIRFASIGTDLYVHGSFPTMEPDAVFFGPDTYRFVSALQRLVPMCRTLVDIGCGSGAGALQLKDRALNIILTDINPLALAFAEANAILAGCTNHQLHCGDLMEKILGAPDVIIANPPYICDPLGRMYRHGGSGIGTALSLRIVREALDHLGPGGRLFLYTGSPIIRGVDTFAESVWPMLKQSHAEVTYDEIDPDVFGDELDNPAYREVDRLAAVLLCVKVAS